MIKLAIVGGRKYMNYNDFKKHVDEYIKEIGVPDEIISGGAIGTDKMAEQYAKDNGISMKIFYPDWNKYGKKAGILRNSDIIASATHVMAFPTEESIGTYDSINKAKKSNKIIKIINIKI